MDEQEISRFAVREIEPIPDLAGSPAYRVAARLTDGLFLPCVLLCNKAARLALAVRRLEETRPRPRFFGRRSAAEAEPYQRVVEVFAAGGNRVNAYDLASLEPSPYAIPLARLREMRGETSMSWTQFVGVMRDGNEFSFGTTYRTEFFDMPAGYQAIDLTSIRPHERGNGHLYKSRPFFYCFVSGLPG